VGSLTRTLAKILKVIAFIVAYTFFVVIISCEIMIQYNITPEHILNSKIMDPVGKGLAIMAVVVLAIIGIPGKKRNMGF